MELALTRINFYGNRWSVVILCCAFSFRDSENEEQDGLTDDESRPLTQEELKMKIMKRVRLFAELLLSTL